MKFIYAKNDNVCSGCKSVIERGAGMVQFFFVLPNGHKKIMCFHNECYIPWYTDMFNRKWSAWFDGAGHYFRSRRGRPPTYTEPTKEQKLNRLNSSMSYHNKLGHELRVRAILSQIERLKK